MQVHVGGGSERLGHCPGIHWHMNVANQVEYRDRRQAPGDSWVRVKDRFGNVREFTAEGVTAEQLAKGERRRMDCMDCHNRPSHTMATTPERAIDELIARGAIPRTLPFVRREAVKALKVTYPTQEAAGEGISRTLRDFYRSQYPQAYMSQRPDVEKAVQATETVYRRNVFPNMKVTFGSYPKQHRPHGLPGLFPLPRRQPQIERRQGHRPGLRVLSQDRIIPERSAHWEECAVLNNSPCGHRVTMSGTRLAAGESARRRSPGIRRHPIGSSMPC
jgi:hypothetical protein